MKVLTRAVLAMEALLIGFAMLLAMDKQSAISLWYGFLIFILLIICAGAMKRKFGIYLGSLLQVSLISYGIFVGAMYVMGTLFAGIWISAIVVGRKGEAIRAELLRKNPAK